MTITAEISILDYQRVQVVVREPGRQKTSVILPESALESYLSELQANAALDGQMLDVRRATGREVRRRA